MRVMSRVIAPVVVDHADGAVRRIHIDPREPLVVAGARVGGIHLRGRAPGGPAIGGRRQEHVGVRHGVVDVVDAIAVVEECEVQSPVACVGSATRLPVIGARSW